MSFSIRSKIINLLRDYPDSLRIGKGNDWGSKYQLIIEGIIGGEKFIIERSDFNEVFIKSPVYKEFGFFSNYLISKEMDKWRDRYLLKLLNKNNKPNKIESES